MFSSVERCSAFLAPDSAIAKNRARIAMISATLLSSTSVARSTASSAGLPFASPNSYSPPSYSASLAISAHAPRTRDATKRAQTTAPRQWADPAEGSPGRTFRGVAGRSGRFATRKIHDLAGERLVFIGRFMAARDFAPQPRDRLPQRLIALGNRLRRDRRFGKARLKTFDFLLQVGTIQACCAQCPLHRRLRGPQRLIFHCQRILFRVGGLCQRRHAGCEIAMRGFGPIHGRVALGQKRELPAVFEHDLLPRGLAALKARLYFLHPRAQPRRLRDPPVEFEQEPHGKRGSCLEFSPQTVRRAHSFGQRRR